MSLDQHPGLPWELDFNPHTYPIPTEKVVGIPMHRGIPTPTDVAKLLEQPKTARHLEI